MLFEDDTSYEGNFADTGVFSGQGVLSYAGGGDQQGSGSDRLEGSFFGSYTDGIKFNGTIFKCRSSGGAATGFVSSGGGESTSGNSRKIGTFSVEATQKWLSIFSRHRQLLFISEEFDRDGDDERESASLSNKAQLAWEHMAILINQAKNCDIAKRQVLSNVLKVVS